MKQSLLEPPADLSEQEREVWHELAPALLRAGLLDHLSLRLFEGLVRYTAEFRHYSRLAGEAKDPTNAAAAREVADNAERRAAEAWRCFLPPDS